MYRQPAQKKTPVPPERIQVFFGQEKSAARVRILLPIAALLTILLTIIVIGSYFLFTGDLQLLLPTSSTPTIPSQDRPPSATVSQSPPKAQDQPKPNTPPGETLYLDNSLVIAKVGEEDIFGTDFNYIIASRYLGKGEKESRPQDEIKKEIVNYLAEKSLVLQFGGQKNWLILTEKIFNHIDKDQKQREEAVKKIEARINQEIEAIDYTVISIWYYNVDPPEIPEAQAKSIAQTKLNTLRQRIADGKISIKQAGEMIKADSSLEQLDKNYRANAYLEVTGAKVSEIEEQSQSSNYFAVLKRAVEQLKPGEISEVLLVKEAGDDYREEYFEVIKLEKRYGSLNFDNWLNKAKENVQIMI